MILEKADEQQEQDKKIGVGKNFASWTGLDHEVNNQKKLFCWDVTHEQVVDRFVACAEVRTEAPINSKNKVLITTEFCKVAQPKLNDDV